MEISSPVFKNKGFIPQKYTCQEENINPPLEIKGIPENTESIVLIIDDPDAPVGDWVHLLVWDLPIKERIEEGELIGGDNYGRNDFQTNDYKGPCPPPGDAHRYFFKVYVLNKRLILGFKAKKENVEKAMEGHILAKAELIGLYKKQ